MYKVCGLVVIGGPVSGQVQYTMCCLCLCSPSISSPPISLPGKSTIPTLRSSISLCSSGSIRPPAQLNSQPWFMPTISLMSIGSQCHLWSVQISPSVNCIHVSTTCLFQQSSQCLGIGLLLAYQIMLMVPPLLTSVKTVNGKLTYMPHTTPAVWVSYPLYWVFSDVHGLQPMHSHHSHVYWVTFIDNYSQFPAVYFITRKSDVFTAFWKYKAWAENLTGEHIGILHNDKGGKYKGTNLDDFLVEASICCEHSIHNTPQQLGMAFLGILLMTHMMRFRDRSLLSWEGLLTAPDLTF